ncbi:Fluoride export protein 1 [Hondaea fermentalgiana]|uniref:Fluoride export protein 1 n=1 Tax=Hondaea fermentalgiana TaxID=2315210 RepID=A0A2R5GVP8_9STRA|nr:Fluoride export protein 1 [Hondaea fermentalgiana]|eukprot:GBG34907.1 Fluoride export protein 1 [Hondaea fermentalgiana]
MLGAEAAGKGSEGRRRGGSGAEEEDAMAPQQDGERGAADGHGDELEDGRGAHNLQQHKMSPQQEEEVLLDDEVLATAGREEASEVPEARKEAREDPEPGFSWLREQLATLALIAVGSIAGVALRIGLGKNAAYPFDSYVFANFLGTAWLAYWSNFKHLIWTPLFVGVGTGFCGSLTTFSSWEEATAVLVGPTTLELSRGQRAFVWFETQLTGIGVILMGYDFGRHLSDALYLVSPKSSENAKSSNGPCVPRMLYEAASVLGAVLLGLLIALLTGFIRTKTLFALCWGPFGAWLRYALGRLLNSKFANFPLGTFLANVFASALLAMAYILGLAVVSADTVQCEVLNGFMTGFCGSLSTVSTFISELKKLKRRDAYVYGFGSMIISQVCMIIIIGGYTWADPDLSDLQNGSSCTSYFYS